MNPAYRECADCAAAKKVYHEATWDGPKQTIVKTTQVSMLCVRRSAGTWKEVQPDDGCFMSLPILLDRKDSPF